MEKISVFLFMFSLALIQCKSENHFENLEEDSLKDNYLSVPTDNAESAAATRMGRRRMGRSINEDLPATRMGRRMGRSINEDLPATRMGRRRKGRSINEDMSATRMGRRMGLSINEDLPATRMGRRMGRSLKVELETENEEPKEVMSGVSTGSAASGRRDGKRWKRSIKSENLLTRILRSTENEFSSGLSFKVDTSDSSESDKSNLRQRRESMAEKWASKGAGYIEQGTAGAAVLSQLGSSAVQMGATEAASALGEAASDGGQKLSEGTFQAGTAMADMLKKGASMIPFENKS